MKRILVGLFVLFGLAAGAQVYNNEWIDYTKTYYKFRVGKDGLCRISGAVCQLTFVGNHTTWTYHPGESTNGCVRILDYDSPDYQEYCQFKHRIDTVICPRLIGDEEMFLNDLCLLRLL